MLTFSLYQYFVFYLGMKVGNVKISNANKSGTLNASANTFKEPVDTQACLSMPPNSLFIFGNMGYIFCDLKFSLFF